MQVSIYGRHASTNSLELSGVAVSEVCSPAVGIPSPPNFIATFGSAAKRQNMLAPEVKALRYTIFIRPYTKQSAEMIDDDLRIGKCARQIDQIGQLIFQLPRIVRQAQFRQMAKAFVKGFI